MQRISSILVVVPDQGTKLFVPKLEVCPKKLRFVAAFTLIEILAVLAILAVIAALMAPLVTSPTEAKSVTISAYQTKTGLENARWMAMAERTYTRVLFPTSDSGLEDETLPYASYKIVSLDRNKNIWRARTGWEKFLPAVVWDPADSSLVDPDKKEPTPIDHNGDGSAEEKFEGVYVEFAPDGSISLDPKAEAKKIIFMAGKVPEAGREQKVKTLNRSGLSVEPLTGGVRILEL